MGVVSKDALLRADKVVFVSEEGAEEGVMLVVIVVILNVVYSVLNVNGGLLDGLDVVDVVEDSRRDGSITSSRHVTAIPLSVGVTACHVTMDSAVKQLKVPELRRILADAGVAASPRAKKDALVNAVINDKNALELFSTRHCQPPDPTTVPDAPAPAPPTPPASTAQSIENTADSELEKRKARAARFGIPLVNPLPDVSTCFLYLCPVSLIFV